MDENGAATALPRDHRAQPGFGTEEREMIAAQCPTCGKLSSLLAPVACPGSECRASVRRGILAFGDGYSEEMTAVHRTNVNTEEKKAARIYWDRHYVDWCLRTAAPYLQTGQAGKRVLSLGCGLALDVAEFLKRGHDAYGVETANLADVWPDLLGNEAPRCVVSTSGMLPFPDESFDLIVSMNVLEHVGTMPPSEFVTPQTDQIRKDFVRGAVAKLKVGGIFVLVAPTRRHPIDRGHSHWYIPGSRKMFVKWGFTPINPFSRHNFLPSAGDVKRWCAEIAEEIPVSVSFKKDRSLFGEPSFPGITNRWLMLLVRALRKVWLKTVPLPHFHAIIVRKPMTSHQTAGKRAAA
jgi:SAM-dependent methyltransferase